MIEDKTKVKKEEQSKNKRAEEVCSLRLKGTPLFLPDELGYACPVCGCSDKVNLQWSEYNFFIWYGKCNLDIPSCLCINYHVPPPTLGGVMIGSKEKVEEATKIFLDCMSDVKINKNQRLQKYIDDNEKKQ